MSYIGLPLTEPTGGQSLVLAARWIVGTLTGTVASLVATLAVAAVGLLMLQGRVEIRRAAVVVTGCFILFGASVISSGIMRIAEVGIARAEATVAAPVPDPVPSFVPPPPQPEVYDPYAGASVPVR